MGSMRIIEGDLLKANADVIVHQVNCKGVMGAGLAKQIRYRFPNTYSCYRDYCFKDPSSKLLGTCLYTLEDQFVICNAFAQDTYGQGKRQTQYDKLEQCFYDLAEKFHEKTVALPWMIGCGLAGGDWNIVSEMINRILVDFGDCNVIIYQWTDKV